MELTKLWYSLNIASVLFAKVQNAEDHDLNR